MDPRALALYNDYIHGDMPRRDFLRRLAGVVGSAAAASALLPLIEPNFAQAQQVAPDDPKLEAGYVEYTGQSGAVRGFLARPADRAGTLPGILVIHENRGLNAHIEDVARRAALAGYVALAPDGLSVAGGAPEDQEKARDLFAATDRATIDADVILAVPYLAGREDCSDRVGTVGFCYGGGIALRCAAEQPATAAAVCFYGQALSAEQVARVKAPLTMHYAGEDPRINAGIPDFRRALDEHGVAYSLHMYPGTGHGFHNDASAARYNATAAQLAWSRTIAFFDAHLKA
ncbi:MAG: dienelactone hydrolase family protein [Xanthomonadaceae bacterium]|nr:dienelactone hydrolase family protein [Xanthomonadaceae bacterium]